MFRQAGLIGTSSNGPASASMEIMSTIYLHILVFIHTCWFREDNWILPIGHLLDRSVYTPPKVSNDTPTYICLLSMLLVVKAYAGENWCAWDRAKNLLHVVLVTEGNDDLVPGPVRSSIPLRHCASPLSRQSHRPKDARL